MRVYIFRMQRYQLYNSHFPLQHSILQMSSIEAIGIAGFRSYNPATLQKIEFNKPLTLIWGPNGSGKTTIIEVMKYIMAGILPPSCERGKNFLMDPRIIGQSDVKGQIRLKFRSFNGRPVMATRKSLFSINNKGSKYQSTQQILKTKDQNGEEIQINHHCAEIQKQIPFLLGTSKAIIDKVMFCHQEQSLWPFEDSAVLKTIFDELFETKKYTQMIEALWDQRKQFQKKIGEIKKALPYQQRLYQEDKQRKITTLKQMEEANKQVEEIIIPIRQKLQAMEIQLSQSEEHVNNEQKIRLALQKRSLEDRVKLNNQVIKKTNERLQILYNEFEKMTGIKITIQKQQIDYYTKQTQEKIYELKKQRQQLSKVIQNIKNTQKFSQKEIELRNAISSAKQFLPQLKKETNQYITDELVYRNIVQKKEILENKIKRLKVFQAELSKCIDLKSNIVFEKSMNQTQFQAEKTRILSDTKVFEQIKLKILSFYFALYKPIDPKASVCNKQDDVGAKLQEVSFRIKMKKQQLQKYQNMPKEMPISKRIDRLQFAGIEFYNTYIEYCQEKKKCSFCSKPLTEEELKTITAKCQKIQEKSQVQIRDLQNQLQNECNHIDADPELMISKLSAQIENLIKSQINLSQRLKNYEIAMKWREQRKINEKLIQGIKITKFEREVETGSAKKFEKYSKEATIELYSEYVRKYIEMSNQIARAKRNIEIFQEQQVKNKQKEIQREKAEQRVRIIGEELKNTRQQTKNYEVIVRIVSKLATLMKEKQSISKFSKQKEDKSQIINPQAISQQISQIDYEIRRTELESQFYHISLKLQSIKEQNLMLLNQIQIFDFQLKNVQNLINERSSKLEQYNNLKAKFEKNAHYVHIRADIAFDQFKRIKSEKEYLKMKSKLIDAENASKDIETYCRVVQNTISKFHQEKMDQINKIISDIWKEVYHEKDIDSIQIETFISEDSKKRRNYHYSIVMYKAGPENIKLEMRGRCSMGQKVLASLVIRMALAEVFASSARFMALDQPTTNLDQGHISSLAQQLTRIIQMNEGGNFQMVIITHDLQLIKKLQKYTNHFYEVSRNENKFSTITRKDIGELYRKF